jgi:hypothetical protein
VKFKDGAGKGLKIRARKGYYAPSPDGSIEMQAKEGVDPYIQAALDSPWAEDGIALRMTHYVGDELMLGKAGVLLVAEVDIRDVAFTREEDRDVGEIEFLLVDAHRESGEFYRYDQSVKMRLRPSTHERLKRVWFPIMRDFELQPGDHQAKIIVRDTSTGAIGSVVHEFEVPPLDGFRVTTPILSDTFRKNEEGVPENPQPLARRQFPSGEQLICQFEVIGAQKDDKGMPEVAQGYEVLRADGTVLTSYPESVIQPTSLGHLSRMFSFRLADTEPGQYKMVMTVEDRLSGAKKVLREEFEVTEPLPEGAEDEEETATTSPSALAAPASSP